MRIGNSVHSNRNNPVAAVPSTKHHIAIIQPIYLDRMLAGQKQIECRISKRRKPPYESVAPGDLIWFKLPSREIRAFSIAGSCDFHLLENPSELVGHIDRLNESICAEPNYLENAMRWARYLSLIEIQSVARINPMTVQKTDQRAWVVLDQIPFPGMSITARSK